MSGMEAGLVKDTADNVLETWNLKHMGDTLGEKKQFETCTRSSIMDVNIHGLTYHHVCRRNFEGPTGSFARNRWWIIDVTDKAVDTTMGQRSQMLG